MPRVSTGWQRSFVVWPLALGLLLTGLGWGLTAVAPRGNGTVPGLALALAGARWLAALWEAYATRRRIARDGWFGAYVALCIALDFVLATYMTWRCMVGAGTPPASDRLVGIAYTYVLLSWYTLVLFLPPVGWPASVSKRCCRCGYDLTGNVSRRCPECGAEVPLDTRSGLIKDSEMLGSGPGAAEVRLFQRWFTPFSALLLVAGAVLYFLLREAGVSPASLFVLWLIAFVVWHVGNTIGRGDVPASALFSSWRAVTVIPIAIEVLALIGLGVFSAWDSTLGALVCVGALAAGCPVVAGQVVRDAVRRYRARMGVASGS